MFWIFSIVSILIYFVFLKKSVNVVAYFTICSIIAFAIFAYEKKQTEQKTELRSFENQIRILQDKRQSIEKEIATREQLSEKYISESQAAINREKEYWENVFNNKAKVFPWAASIYADCMFSSDMDISNNLRYKKRPAIKASEEVKSIALAKREETFKRKEAEYLVSYYESLYPILAELREPCEADKNENASDDQMVDSFIIEGDDASYWLSKEEYNALPNIEKYQLALDRYWKRKKSNWEIGRDYERYIGYKYEQAKYDVYYQGIIDGLEDLGRDLICKKNGSIHIVQCKYWACSKEIHEKHINQLFGTTAMHYLQSLKHGNTLTDFTNSIRTGKIVPVFVTSTKLSDTAMEFAKMLGVEVRQGVKLEPYPLIKCNVSKRTGERIYHLPFDQQYDKIKIEGNNEFFAHTIKEAEEKGFRRAFKWRPE